jgi:hypothetical protein
MQPQFEWSDRHAEALRTLSPWLIQELLGAEWPGTPRSRCGGGYLPITSSNLRAALPTWAQGQGSPTAPMLAPS